MDISIGMKRERAQRFAEELKGALQRSTGTFEVTLYCLNNDSASDEVTITINNDDMERDDVDVDEIYVDVQDD